MMIEPTISDLMKKFDSRYTLAMATAKRARQLTDGDTPLTKKGLGIKPVTVAVNELFEEKVKCTGKPSDLSPDTAEIGMAEISSDSTDFDLVELGETDAGFGSNSANAEITEDNVNIEALID